MRSAWQEFAEQRKKYQAEYQLLTQPYDIKDNKVILHLLSKIFPFWQEDDPAASVQAAD